MRRLPANTDKTYFDVQILNIPYCQFRHEILNHPVRRILFRFSRQHLKAAPVFVSAYLLRLQCQSAGSLKTQERIFSGGYSCGPCGLNSITLLSSHSFLHFLSDILPVTTNEEIVALNLTCFLMFSLIDVKIANQPLD